MTNRSITGRTTTILAAVLAALALVLSACAADDDDGEVTMAGPTGTAATCRPPSTPNS